MSRVLMISDLHLGHENMAKKRGWSNTDEFHEALIADWNKEVRKRDTIYILGDITMESDKYYPVLNELNGVKHVVMGNHDMLRHTRELLKYCKSVSGCVKYKGCILTHIPIHESEIDRFKFNIHGHIHEFNIEADKYINVCIEQVGLAPIEFSKLITEKGRI